MPNSLRDNINQAYAKQRLTSSDVNQLLVSLQVHQRLYNTLKQISRAMTDVRANGVIVADTLPENALAEIDKIIAALNALGV